MHRLTDAEMLRRSDFNARGDVGRTGRLIEVPAATAAGARLDEAGTSA